MEPDYKVKSLAKAMKVLECFSIKTPELGITEIAEMVELQKSTVHNIITTFQQMGYVAQNPQTGKYYLGLRCLHFGYIINNHLGLRQLFLPYLTRIAREAGETCYLGIPNGTDVLYIESASPAGITTTRAILGERAPLYCTGLGKAMLAHMPSDAVKECLAQPLEPFTDSTITQPQALLDDLALTRERGYSTDNMEHEYGIRCVAVPVLGNDQRVIAAVSVSGPSLRFGPEDICRNARIIKEILAPLQGSM